jgi:hypothetical protein
MILGAIAALEQARRLRCPSNLGQKLPPYQSCPSCGGTGLLPKPREGLPPVCAKMREVPENIGAGEGNRTLVFSLEGFRRLNTFKAHSDKRQLKALLNRNCFFCLSELAQVPKSPPPPVSSFHPWAGDSQSARAQCRSCATTAAAPLPRNRPGSGGCPLPPGGPDGCAPRTGRWPRFREM